MKLGLDLHGVIDACPDLFSELSFLFVKKGHEVHIITGSSITDKLTEDLRQRGIFWTHLFSIVDWHKARGSKIHYDENGQPWMDAYTWDKTKAEYCDRVGIDFHIDDSDTYGYFFKTPYMRFFSKNGERQRKMKSWEKEEG